MSVAAPGGNGMMMRIGFDGYACASARAGTASRMDPSAAAILRVCLPILFPPRAIIHAMQVIEMQKPGGPDVLQIADKPLPEPAAGEVRVRAEAAGISSAD